MPPSPPPFTTAGDAQRSPTVSVIIPTLNEETNLPLVLEGLPDVHQVVVVDGGSDDDTVAVAREVRPDAIIVRQTRTGKGNAVVCGFQACTGDIVITLNGDGTTDPGEIPRYVDALLAGAEVAHGSRYRDGGGNLDERRFDRLGARILNRIVNALFGTRFTDLGYGYNAYWRSLLPVLDLPAPKLPGRRGGAVWGDGSEIEPLINIRMAAQGLRVVEVASVGYPRIHGTRQRRPTHECALALRATVSEYHRRWKIGRQTDRHAQDNARHNPRHGASTGVGRGGRRQAPSDEAGLGSFLPPEPRPTGRHAARPTESARDQGDADPRGHRYAGQGDQRHGGWTHVPNPQQEPPWSRRPETPAIDQQSWRSSYTDPDSVIPGDFRPHRDLRGTAHQPGPAERRSRQRWHTPDTASQPATWHLPAPFEPIGEGRPDLTVLPGGGATYAPDGHTGYPARTAHLRAVPGEGYGRAAHRS